MCKTKEGHVSGERGRLVCVKPKGHVSGERGPLVCVKPKRGVYQGKEDLLGV